MWDSLSHSHYDSSSSSCCYHSQFSLSLRARERKLSQVAWPRLAAALNATVDAAGRGARVAHVVNEGLHAARGAPGARAAPLDALLSRLGAWSRAHAGARVVWRETWPQHFATSDGRGQYADRDERAAATCARDLAGYPRALAEVARRVAAASPVRFAPTFEGPRG